MLATPAMTGVSPTSVTGSYGTRTRAAMPSPHAKFRKKPTSAVAVVTEPTTSQGLGGADGAALAARKGAVRISTKPTKSTRWVGLSSASTPRSTPKAACQAASPAPPNANSTIPMRAPS